MKQAGSIQPSSFTLHTSLPLPSLAGVPDKGGVVSSGTLRFVTAAAWAGVLQPKHWNLAASLGGHLAGPLEAALRDCANLKGETYVGFTDDFERPNNWGLSVDCDGFREQAKLPDTVDLGAFCVSTKPMWYCVGSKLEALEKALPGFGARVLHSLDVGAGRGLGLIGFNSMLWFAAHNYGGLPGDLEALVEPEYLFGDGASTVVVGATYAQKWLRPYPWGHTSWRPVGNRELYNHPSQLIDILHRLCKKSTGCW
jgi:hypothetical protein